MAEINTEDDYLHKLGKLVPIYVVVLTSSLDSLLGIFEDLVFKIFGIVLISSAALLLVYVIEIKQQKITNRAHLGMLFGSTLIYCFILFFRVYIEPDAQLSAAVAMVVIVWTFITPYLYELFVKKEVSSEVS